MKILISILSAVLFSFPLHAQTVANISIPDTATHSEPTKSLVLNGAGIRTKFIFDIYIGALYLEKKQNTTKAIYQLAGEKRIYMHFLYDEISKEKLTNSWSEGFKNNHNDTELVELQSRIEQFNSLFTAVKKGDVINLNFIPDNGTTVIINGNTRGIIKGNDFFIALLKIWLGQDPADSELKQAMLGIPNE